MTNRTNKSVLKKIDEPTRLLTGFFGHVVQANGLEALFIEGKPYGKRDCGCMPLRWFYELNFPWKASMNMRMKHIIDVLGVN